MGQHRRRLLGGGGVLAAGAAAVIFAGSAPAADNPGTAGRAAQDQGVSGDFSAVMMIHTTSSSYGDLPGVNPWNGRKSQGTRFAYRSIPCTGNAPVNNISSDLPSYGTRVARSRAPSSMRAHPFRFRLRKRDGRWEMSGRITFTVCQLQPGPTPTTETVTDARKPKIFVRFNATFKRETVESLHWSGTFRLRGGTQRYNDLEGSGQIAGYFMCFAPEGCAALNKGYLDGQFVMQGSYRDPTPELAAG